MRSGSIQRRTRTASLAGFWLSLSRGGLSDAGRFDSFQFRYAIKQRIGARLNCLRQLGEGEKGTRDFPRLDVADRLPVDADEFRNALLRQPSFQARRFRVRADESKYLPVCHPIFETMPTPQLTSNIFDATSSPVVKRRNGKPLTPEQALSKRPNEYSSILTTHWP